MFVDENLFAYDFAIVSIMKNAAQYVKEWLDYHLLAGVNHFFIYDNESEDNFKEILQPYIDAGLVTYIFYPGQRIMMAAFNEALDNFKYLCRYIAFVDDDEFILPRNNRSIPDTTDKLWFDEAQIGGLEISWVFYGSNGLKTADLNRGVLERFTRRASKEARSVKSIVNPRRVNYMWTPHFAVYFDNFVGIDFRDRADLNDKIVMNHYSVKSLEEFIRRKKGTDANFGDAWNDIEETFNRLDTGCNEVFDDSILKYRAERQTALVPNGDIIETFSARNKVDFEKIFKELVYNLLPLDLGDNLKNFFRSGPNQLHYFQAVNEFYKVAPTDFFKGRLETFLTCWGVSNFLKGKFLDEDLARNLEKISLNAVVYTLQAGTSFSDVQCLMKEMPRLLALPYPVVNTIRRICIKMIEEAQTDIRNSIKNGPQLQRWSEILDWERLRKMLLAFDNYTHK